MVLPVRAEQVEMVLSVQTGEVWVIVVSVLVSVLVSVQVLVSVLVLVQVQKAQEQVVPVWYSEQAVCQKAR